MIDWMTAAIWGLYKQFSKRVPDAPLELKIDRHRRQTPVVEVIKILRK